MCASFSELKQPFVEFFDVLESYGPGDLQIVDENYECHFLWLVDDDLLSNFLACDSEKNKKFRAIKSSCHCLCVSQW